MKFVYGSKPKAADDKVRKSTSYIVKSMIKQYAANKGKRCSPSFIAWLNRRVIEVMDFQISALGGKVTLNGHDAELITKLKR
jgi:hypothetical protein